MQIRGESSPDLGGPDEVIFAVPTWVIVAKLASAALLVALALLSVNGPQMVVGLVAAGAVGAYGLRDVIARVRLAADASGVVAVRGYAGHRRLAWSEIERVRVDTRSRFGARSELLELDAGAEIFLFSRYDLGAEPDAAAAALEAVRVR